MEQQFYKDDKVVFDRTGEVFKVLYSSVTDTGDNLMLIEDREGNQNWRKELGYSLFEKKPDVAHRVGLDMRKRLHGKPNMSGLAEAMSDVDFTITKSEPDLVDEWEDLDAEDEPETGQNDGGENSFYKLPDWVYDVDTLSEYLELDPYQFNMLKALWSNKGQRHTATNKHREANKALHYAQREVDKLQRLKG